MVFQEILEQALNTSERDVFAIYRKKRTYDDHETRFPYLSLDTTAKYEDYAPIYIGEFQKGQSLEALFYIFNEEHPEDYHSYSLSVGDVIALKRGDVFSAHMVATCGYTLLPSFLPQQKTEAAICALCGDSAITGETYCKRCNALDHLLDSGINTEEIVMRFWECCPDCSTEIIASCYLSVDTLRIQCDGCGKTHTIPFALDDIQRYVRVGVSRDLEQFML